MMEWITGKEHDVREVECRAQGAESCKFVIPKKGREEVTV
jgi:predicted hydrocarbon binding protein